MSTSTKKVTKRLVDSAKTDSKRVHITPRSGGWAVRKEGNIQAHKVVTSKKSAIEIAKKLVQDGKGSEVIIHAKDGQFRVAK